MGKIFFRAEGSSAIGLGHLIRSSALADMIHRYFNIHFVINADAPKGIQENLQKKYSLDCIENNNQLLEMITRGDGVVLDGYEYDSHLQQSLKQRSAGLICIDDVHDKHYFADLIINQALGISKNDYVAEGYTRILVGSQYAIVRAPFLKSKGSDIHKTAEKLFVCFGGSDINNYTISILEILENVFEGSEINTVVGESYLYLDTLKKFQRSSSKKIQIYRNIDPELLASVILGSDLAIVPASSILMEVLSLGVPAIGGYYAKNQRDIYNGYLDAGLIYAAGDFNDIEKVKTVIRQTLKSDISSKQKIISKYFDGNSPRRILKEFIRLFFPSHGFTRKADKKDAPLLFEWANDPVTRNNAIHSNAIRWEDHLEWFAKKLADPASLILITDFNNIPVGQIRFDESRETIDITYAVAPEHRGLGFGELIIDKGIEWYKSQHVFDKPFKALVKPANGASVKVFEKNNFALKGTVQVGDQIYSEYQLMLG